MAGEALISVASEAALSKLVSLVTEEIGAAWGLKEELKTLSAKSAMILALMRDAERCQVKGEAATLWLKNLKNAAYDADDLMDEFAFEMLRRKLEIQNRMKNKVRNFFSTSNPIAFRFKMAYRIKDTKRMLDQVIGEGTKLGLQSVVHQGRESSGISTGHEKIRLTQPFINDSKVFGREIDKSIVTNMLLNSESEEQLSFVAILGLGGLGKTTLAQLIYKEESVTRHFDGQRIWVCVSNDFSVTRILKEMAESLKLNIAHMSNIEAIILRLTEKLKGTKYLLVLDDVWNTNDEKWDLLRNSLLGINGSKGSKVLVTTRNDKVALTAQALQTLHLGKLSEEDSWSIFHERAFARGGAKQTPYLEDVGKKIVKRCGGMPLALKALGGLMHSKEEHEWISMEKSSIWELSYEETGIMPILRLSFDQLPLWSKQCFAYCSLFPKDFQFEKDNLIQLWIAQGFIQASQESNSVMEDIGNEYFKSLLWISYFQDVKMDTYGNITHCKMHDLVHDLAVLVSKSECLALDANKVKIKDIVVRHLSTGENENLVQTISKENARRLRTLSMASYAADNFLKKFNYLRVLTLERSKIKELPAKIGKLKHLRYLDVSDTKITTFPASLTKLYNLQTLRLMDCINFEEFPEELANLVNLRHLYFNYGKMPRKIGQLTSLQTLICFTVGKDNGHQIEELRPLSKLRSEVTLRNLELVRDKEEARRATLWEKTNLYKLSLIWSEERESANNDGDVLEGLQPPPNLKGLTIQGFRGGKLPSWMTLDTMNNKGLPQRLVKIELTNCKKCKQIPTLGELPFLRFLEISGMHNVKRIGTEFYSKNECGAHTSSVGSSSQNKGCTLFPALEILSLKNMDNLVKWTEAANDATCLSVVFPRLQTLGIEKCSKLTTIPSHFPSLTDLRIVCVKSGVPIAQISSKVITLKDVFIENISKLTTLPEELFQNNKSNLTRLSINSCKKLSYIPPDGLQMVASSLEYLKIKECPKLISIPSLQSLTSLHELEIYGCGGVTNLPIGLGTCTSLEKLTVAFCRNLISVSTEDLRELKSLSSLGIHTCGKLKSLPLEEFLHCLTRLENLIIGWFSKELESFPFNFSNPDYIHQHLQRLLFLNLIGWPKLKSLPDQIRHLPALRYLYIGGFDGVEALPEWLGDLSSLQWLGIWCCNNLKYLPSAESIRRLTNLRWLYIYKCCHLKERCNNRSGEGGTEWSKISHIQIIRIDGVVIQHLTASSSN